VDGWINLNRETMRYSLEKVNTPQACDVLLTQAQIKKQRLERRRRNLGETIGTFRQRLDQVSRETAEVQATLETFIVAYEALAEGKDKASLKVKIKRLELRLAVLESKAYTYHAAALVARQMKYNVLDSQVIAIEAYMALLTRKRAALSGVALRTGQAAHLSRPPVTRTDFAPGGLPVITGLKIVDNPTFLRDQRHGHVYFLSVVRINLGADAP
jgi:hypothetical protein